jgi:hypothetical protein
MDIPTGINLLSMSFTLYNGKTISYRTHFTFVDVFVKTGGFIGLLNLLCGKLAKYIGKMKYTHDIMVSIYKINNKPLKSIRKSKQKRIGKDLEISSEDVDQ